MEIIQIVTLILSIFAIGLLFVVLRSLAKNKTSQKTEEIEELKTKITALERDIQRQIEDANVRQTQIIASSFVDTNKLVLDRINAVLAQTEKGNAETVQTINQNLDKINKSVNDQLAENLQKRLDSSYSKVSESLERIHKWLGEMQELSTGVTDLKKVLTGVKTRGEWGEASLEALLEQILTIDQYKRQVNISGQNAVDFAVILPGKERKDSVLLPIDAKFPIEDYQRLCEAQDKGDSQGMDFARRELVKRVKSEALSIRDKYVKPPKTTDFAIMFVPTEGLFAELLRTPGLSDELQKNKVIIAGPTTLSALLNSLRMGFKTLAIEKRSTEIGKLLASFQKDFTLYLKNLTKTSTQLETAQHTLTDVVKRSEKIQQKLEKVQNYTSVEGEDGTLIGENVGVDDEE